MNMRYARSRLSEKEMEQNCEKIQSFLRHSDDYKNPNLCIWDISLATEIAPAAISQSLNRFLNLNFFDVVNRKRSRSTFYAAFNKLEGTSPAKWLKTALETDKANEKTPPG